MADDPKPEAAPAVVSDPKPEPMQQAPAAPDKKPEPPKVEAPKVEAEKPAEAPKPAPVPDAPAAPVHAPEAFRITLDDACARISERDRRMELIAAFHADETAAGHRRDLETTFRDRFAAFARRPA